MLKRRFKIYLHNMLVLEIPTKDIMCFDTWVSKVV